MSPMQRTVIVATWIEKSALSECMKCDAVCEMHPPTHNTMPAALVDIGVGGVSVAGTISPFSIWVDAATFGLLLAVAAFFRNLFATVSAFHSAEWQSTFNKHNLHTPIQISNNYAKEITVIMLFNRFQYWTKTSCTADRVDFVCRYLHLALAVTIIKRFQ